MTDPSHTSARIFRPGRIRGCLVDQEFKTPTDSVGHLFPGESGLRLFIPVPSDVMPELLTMMKTVRVKQVDFAAPTLKRSIRRVKRIWLSMNGDEETSHEHETVPASETAAPSTRAKTSRLGNRPGLGCRFVDEPAN